eukprot:365978-Chlamydomonas_euryale.AAC.1
MLGPQRRESTRPTPSHLPRLSLIHLTSHAVPAVSAAPPTAPVSVHAISRLQPGSPNIFFVLSCRSLACRFTVPCAHPGGEGRAPRLQRGPTLWYAYYICVLVGRRGFCAASSTVSPVGSAAQCALKTLARSDGGGGGFRKPHPADA